ncbi:Acyl transferase domain-containing protein [Actinokineospora alba]|uniref:Acyl transferase domain-containing protein n=1 Tax=Actinokineospora alba TaxID=504798 RepID=A0A1H0QXW7_9PSEU|nr:acyl transferase domain-containing protein [Actinokineospora alba]SDI33741.1 Acyl transferase domain-containing protein [Actinokineospora alba]SDP22122.1 Acyl transferase domain-containing protein [Actinokineospora alba]
MRNHVTDNDDMNDRGDTMVPSTDIAIVGMSGRFPGAADVAGLWANIRAGLSGLTRFTDDELRAAGVPRELLEDPGYVKAGAVLDGIELFDAGFFGVNPKEAQILDPQHRLFLEHSWEALEDAGCDPTRFDGAIGVIAGSSWSSYLQNNLSPSGIAASMGELAVGLANDKDSLTTRVAHTLGLTGPSYAVQSYCSTSLVAVCAAASSLANFESDLVLAGGVNVAVPHRVGYLYQQGGIAPPDGECRAFDAAGLGSLVGSGVGVVALRRLEDAIAEGDRVYAVIRGWAVNNDGGRKVGFTAPGVQGQAAVIAEALACADLTPADIDYIEAHGTGTALGDAAELAAMQQVFRDQSVKIGSIKTNVGHLDRAAGVTNLIKAALALRNEEIPPSRNLTEPNRQLSTGDARLEVVTSLTAWPREEIHIRRAGVSAFGIGGTNAHVVVEEAPLVSRPEPRPRPELLVWSARSADAADAMTTRLADYLDTGAERLSDVAFTLQTGRQVFEHRRAIVASTVDGTVASLRDSAALGRTDGRADRDVALLIAGTGEQYPGMAADLYETEPVFRAVLDECRMVLVERLGLDPLEEMLSSRESTDGSGLSWLLGREGDTTPGAGESTDRLQPAMFAVEYALARLLESWGIRPTVLAGYSVGEYVAACLAGVLSLPDALALVARRAQLINAMPGGAMAAIPKSAADVRDLIERAGITGVDVAAVNGPDLTVVAGEPEAMHALRTFLEGEAVPSRPLATTHAFHSAMLEPIRAALTEWVAANVTLNAPEIPYISNVTGTLATAEQLTDPGYWAEHMCAPVQFDAVLSTLLEQGDLALLEIGPGQSLGAMVRGHRDCPQDRWPLVVPTIPAAGDPRQASVMLAEAVGRLWLAGVPIDWAGYQDDRSVGKVGLPSYPFQKQRYWIDPPIGQTAVAAVSANLLVGELDEPVDHVRLMTPQWTDTALTGDLVPLERCVLLADATGVADALAESLRADKVDVVVLRDAHSLAETDEIPTTLVDLRLLDREESDEDGRDVVAPIAAMLDAWGGQGGNTRVILVTRGGQAVTTAESPVPAHAAAAGLPVVANQEYLNLECRTVDLDPVATPEASAKALAAEVRRPADDVLATYRKGVRFVRGYAPTESDRPGTPIRRGGTYLVTGGLGDVGLILAEHLATAGAAKLILTSRGGIPTGIGDRRSDGVARLRALGAEVLTPAVDVTDAAAMRAMLAETLADGRLDGVVHAAAVTGPETFRALRDIDTEAVDWHFGAKVAGALALGEVLGELPTEQAPDFCVVFSSTSSILGGITFGSYAAANAALSAVGHANHARFVAGESPTCWIAASWDTWSITLERMQVGVGAAMVAHSMSTEEGLQAFDRLLTERQPNLVVAAGGLDDRLPRAAAMLDTTVGAADRFPRPELAQSYAPPLTRTERSLAELWTDVIGVEPVGIKDAFFDLGGNSLLALQMLALVKKRFGVSLPAVTLFEAPTVHTLAAILDQHGVAAPASTTPAITKVRARQENDDDRRIAVIGMAGRFPGAPDVRTFWNNIRGGVESISFFTDEELLASGVTREEFSDPSYVRARPVLDNVSDFDAGFFGMNPRMAAVTDPQQRMFLEVCWEALEQAGYVTPKHRGRVGVYGGANISTYLLQNPASLTDGQFSIYEVIMGNDKDALTTTVSYLLDLYGPSVAVQTFCSTSLVAIHLAIQSLRSGESEMAIAGGVSIRVPDKIGHEHMPGGMESPDGHVRTFDAQAQGSMFGDGAAAVVLKRLSDAIRDGDHIWSVIRGSAMNNDGALKVGYTAPSVIGQSRVIIDAMADAGVTGDDVSYIEAHGTATELGDPIEVTALTRAFGDTKEKQFCPIGSVKTNVGHLDRAAGVTGLIKTSLALWDKVIPPSLHYTAPNPKIDFANSPFYVNTELSPWPERDGRPPIAGINSLGMGGTNVHLVVEQAPERALATAANPESARRYHVLPVSARSAVAADEALAQLGAHLGSATDTRLADVAYTLQVGRKTFEHRRALVSAGIDEAATALTEGEVLGRVDTTTGRQVAFVFSGVGEQYPGLVNQLYQREPVFRGVLDDCLARLAETLPDVDLKDLLTGERGAGANLAALLGRGDDSTDERVSTLERTEIVQPALFAVEYALAKTLMTWGLQPQVMLGYSLGEYVAACLSGVLSLPDALALVAHRAKLIDTVDAGSMVAVPMPVAELEQFGFPERGLDIAAVNGPQMTVVAGPVDAVDAFVADLREAEIPCRPLQTTHAFHTRMLDGISGELTEWVKANLTLNAPEIPYISNVTGTRVTTEQATNPAYWARHMCQTVKFTAGIETLLADQELAIIEIGPGQSLGAMIRGAGAPPTRWPLILSTLPSANETRADDAVLTDLLARLWLNGVDLDWTVYHNRHEDAADDVLQPNRIPLPTYPFQRQRYWMESSGRPALPAAGKPVVVEDEGPHVRVMRPDWTEAKIVGKPATLGTCVLYADTLGVADALAESLRAVGTEAVVVPSGALTAADHAALVRKHASKTQNIVVDLRLLDHPESDVDGRDVVRPTAAMLDAWGSDGSGSARVIVVTRGGQVISEGDTPLPAQSAAAILQMVANLEYLNLECSTVDVTGDAAEAAQALLAEIQRPEDVGDVLMAYRGGTRYVRGFAPMEPGSGKAGNHSVRKGGTYLITGGLGDLGLLIAEHFAKQGAGRLVLTSRGGVPTGIGDRRSDGVARLQELGAEVITPAVDVTDLDGMRAVIADLLVDGGTLDGVVHAAAVTDPDTFRALREVDEEAVGLHFGAKVVGVRVLETLLGELTDEQAPDFCLLFSSTSAVLGGITFACYAASNAALAAIGYRNHMRYTAGQIPTCWISSSWDTWSVENGHGTLGAAMSKHAMTAEEALDALDKLLAEPGPWLVVAAGGLDERLPRAVTVSEVVSTGPKLPRPDLPQPYAPPVTATEKSLCELWSHLLGIEPIGIKDAFFDLGGNSLLGLQMLALVKKRFGIAVAAVTLFESPTVQALSLVLDPEGKSGKAKTTVTARPERPAVELTDDRRIAVVGMAGRFPGAPDVAAFWDNLRGGVESIKVFSEEEMLASGVTPEEIANPAYVPARPVLDNVRGFDAAFFGMSPRMAAITDPQQRLFLEVCWEALEQSGYVVPEHRGRVGVFGGANLSTYLMRMPERLADGEFSTYEVIMGNDKDALTLTVSYLLDLYGPSVAVQTFCSTSLVATHMAIQALRNGECEMAMAGGVSVRVPDKIGHEFAAGGMESPDGHVRTFDAQARGSMFGDGAAVVVLKRLSDALRDGDHIWSVIRGSAMNNDGALKVGFTAPSVVGQSRVVVDAHADAGITGDDVSYIEAHGTATELGDPIEVAALTRAFGDTKDKQYCAIGSVKTNVGHLDRAAGVTGLIKTSLAIGEQVIPPTLHFTSPNPQIDFENSPFYVNTELSPWPTNGKPPIAGINSLGMGGTNVHVVVEQAPERPVPPPADPETSRRYQVIPVSARNNGAIEAACARLGSHLDGSEARLLDIAYTLQVGRKTFEHRRAVVADSVEGAKAMLDGDVAGLLGRVDTTTGRQVAFVFAGVGEQYPGMVTELYKREPVFRAVLDECVGHLADALPDVDLTDLLAGERGGGLDLAALMGRNGSAPDARASTLERTEVVQPALFAVEYALAKTLMTWGLQPQVMLGYSLGEYVAACLSGVLSLPDALKLVAHRAKLIEALPGGAMAGVSLSVAELGAYNLQDRGLDIATVNGPSMTVVAGPTEAMAAFVADLREAEVPCRELQTTHAFHSRMLNEISDELTTWVKDNLTLNAPEIDYISNVTGTRVTAQQVTNPAYWARHMCQTVQFASGIATLLADEELVIVEIGPGQSLGAMIRGANCPPSRWPLILNTLPPAGDSRADDAVFTDCLARLWLTGVELDWTTYHDRHNPDADLATQPNRIPLPTYPFQRQDYWIEPPVRGAVLQAGQIPAEATLEVLADLPKLPQEQWLHLPVWRQTASPAPVEGQPGSWLVFTRDGVAEDVVAGLQKSIGKTGATLRLVRPGTAYSVEENSHTLRPGNVDDTLALLRDLRTAGTPLERVVHLWTLGEESGDETVRLGLHTLVALARAAGELGMEGWSLDVASAGTQQVLPGDKANPHAATLTGPSMVIPLEYPTVSARLLDVDADLGARAVKALVAELGRPFTDRIVALRHGRRWLPSYESMTAPSTVDSTVLRDGGVYLITGGLGGIGLAMAEQLAMDRSAKLVLFGRNGLPERETWPAILAGDAGNPIQRRRVAGVSALLELGAEVEIVAGDVSNAADVRRAVDVALERFGALNGVLHAAGVPGMGLMQFKQPDELDQVLAPKVAGTLAIAEALRIGEPDEVELDFWVLFSSITSATGGGPGQVDYCSANAFLDAYAHQLAATGRNVLSVDWGEWIWNAWADGLAGYSETLQEFLLENRERIGIGFAEGWQSLLRALDCGEPRVVVSTQDFDTMVRFSSQFTLEAVMSSAMAEGGGTRHPRPDLVTLFQEPSGDTEETIAAMWCEALRLEQVGVLDNFFELGGNSLLGVNIVAALRKKFELDELPPHILYEAPTVASLAKVIEAAADGPAAAETANGDGGVRAQLRRSGLEAAGARRRGR